MAERGLRVLAVATRSLTTEQERNGPWRLEDFEDHLTLLGLIGMEDPPRPEVPEALAACRRAPDFDLCVAVGNRIWIGAAGAGALVVIVNFRSTASSF